MWARWHQQHRPIVAVHMSGLSVCAQTCSIDVVDEAHACLHHVLYAHYYCHGASAHKCTCVVMLSILLAVIQQSCSLIFV